MTSTKIRVPVGAYVDAANNRDPKATAACFREDAVVADEGRQRRGIPAIREWAEEVSGKYRPTMEVIDVAETNGKTIVTGRVSGNFPGSPVELRYAFTLQGDKIAWLEIS